MFIKGAPAFSCVNFPGKMTSDGLAVAIYKPYRTSSIIMLLVCLRKIPSDVDPVASYKTPASCYSSQICCSKSWVRKTAWWFHQMETFTALLAICVGNSPVPGESPRTKAGDAELWCFLWPASEYAIEKTIVRLVIWDAIAPIMTPL